MNHRHRSPVKNALIKFLIVCASLLLGCALFLGITSLRVGLTHPEQSGSWVPVSAGVLTIGLALWFYIRLICSLVRAMKRSDILSP